MKREVFGDILSGSEPSRNPIHNRNPYKRMRHPKPLARAWPWFKEDGDQGGQQGDTDQDQVPDS